MGNTFVTWLVVAALAGLGLFFVFGSPDSAAVAETSGSLTTSGAAPISYWEDARSAAAAVPPPVAPSAIHEGQPCASCSAAVSVAAPLSVAAPAVALAGGCGGPAIPCGGASCGPVKTCPARVASPAPASPCGDVACAACGCDLCGQAEGACEAHPCDKCPAAPCPHKLDCASCPAALPPVTATCPVTRCDDRPRISRHGVACVEECAFLQLFAIVPKSMCGSTRFEWAATRGRFLDPGSATPLYYAPTTALADGEDVLITLTATDGQGNEYTDQLKLHVNDSP